MEPHVIPVSTVSSAKISHPELQEHVYEEKWRNKGENFALNSLTL